MTQVIDIPSGFLLTNGSESCGLHGQNEASLMLKVALPPDAIDREMGAVIRKEPRDIASWCR